MISETTDVMAEAERALASLRFPMAGNRLPDNARPVCWEEFGGDSMVAQRRSCLPLEPNAVVDLEIALGHTHLGADEASSLRCGTVLPLDGGVGELVDVYANGQRIARGEALIVDGVFGVRIVELFDRGV